MHSTTKEGGLDPADEPAAHPFTELSPSSPVFQNRLLSPGYRFTGKVWMNELSVVKPIGSSAPQSSRLALPISQYDQP
jgi:hypothetical protein